MKPASFLCYMFLWTLRCTTFNSIAIILILTDKNVALIYSSQFVNRKQRVVYCQAALNITYSSVVFAPHPPPPGGCTPPVIGKWWGGIDYNRVTFSLELLKCDRTFSEFGDHKIQVDTDLKIGRFLVH